MRFEFLFPGKTKESYLAAGIEDFGGRLRRHAAVDIRILKERARKGKEPEAKIRAEEGGRLLAHIAKGSFLVALDPGGRRFSSEEFADLLSCWENQGRKRITFVLGGPLGLSPEVLASADLTLSLSRMTFTHDMARLLLLEQLYRACTIKAGTGYHK